MLQRLAASCVAALVFLLPSLPARASETGPQLHGKAAALIDGATGQILYQQNGADTNFPASTTKLLTALVAVEHGDLEKIITVSAEAVNRQWDESSCYLYEGEQQKLRHLLYGLLLASGNDCAVAIAEGVTNGKPEQFIAWMNETARAHGAFDSHFTNPHGLHDPDHYTTARDLAMIGRAALSNKTVREIASTKEFVWPRKVNAVGKPINGPYYNHNAMLWDYGGTYGGKTGFTEQAGLTLVSAAERDGRKLIGVVMGEKFKTEQYQDMKALLDYGFEFFEKRPVITAGSPAGTVAVEDGKKETATLEIKGSFDVLVLKGAEPNVTQERKVPVAVKAPVEANQKLGVVELKVGDQVLGTVDVVASEAVEAKPPVLAMIRGWSLTGAKWMAYAVGGLLGFRIVVKGTRRTMRRLKKGPQRYRSKPASTLSMYRTRGD